MGYWKRDGPGFIAQVGPTPGFSGQWRAGSMRTASPTGRSPVASDGVLTTLLWTTIVVDPPPSRFIASVRPSDCAASAASVMLSPRDWGRAAVRSDQHEFAVSIGAGDGAWVSFGREAVVPAGLGGDQQTVLQWSDIEMSGGWGETSACPIPATHEYAEIFGAKVLPRAPARLR